MQEKSGSGQSDDAACCLKLVSPHRLICGTLNILHSVLSGFYSPSAIAAEARNCEAINLKFVSQERHFSGSVLHTE